MAPVILKMAQLDTMTVKAQVSEADVLKIKPGLAVYFTIPGDPDTRYNATLKAIGQVLWTLQASPEQQAKTVKPSSTTPFLMSPTLKAASTST